MSSLLIGIVGFARTGKDTVGNYLAEQHGFTRLASADLLRDVLYGANPFIEIHRGAIAGLGDVYRESVRLQAIVDDIGWERAKLEYPEVRRLLQDLGTEGVRRVLGADTWINETLRRAAAIAGPVVITDTRFPNEAALTKQAGGVTWRVDRPGVGALNDHASERHIMTICVDAVINNDGTLEDLYARVDAELAKLKPAPSDPWPGATALGRHYTGGPLHIDVI